MDNHSTNLYLIAVFRNDINHEIKTQKPFRFGKAFFKTLLLNQFLINFFTPAFSSEVNLIIYIPVERALIFIL